MAKSVLFFLAALGVLCCFSLNSENWSIDLEFTPSSGSRFFVLNDWQGTFSEDKNMAALPAAKVSDIMLKSMGILRDGATWPGVQMANLFDRPMATALFLIDGVSSDPSLESLSSSSFQVDQTGLTGCTCADTKLLFSGDNVARHLSNLFDQQSLTHSVSANLMAAQASSANGAYTGSEQLDQLVKEVRGGQITLSSYGLEAAATKLEPTNDVDAKFIAELVLIKQTVDLLGELSGYVNDGSPDVFVFTVSSLEGMEKRYGKGSSKMGVATELVKRVIQESSAKLVKLYNGRVLVQALVLEWNRPALDTSAPELESAYNLLRPYLAQEDRESFLSSLPRVVLKEEYRSDSYLCTTLKKLVKGSHFYAHCTEQAPNMPPPHARAQKNWYDSRMKRSLDFDDVDNDNATLSAVNATGIVESRSSNFSALFLITLFVTVSLGLALYAVSWILWNMDPGRDSVIYRQVADPTVRMQN